MSEVLLCSKCSEYSYTKQSHERCINKNCSCDCRGPIVDLTNVRVRLLVAQILQNVADNSVINADSEAACYVNNLIKDFALEKMQELLGIKQEIEDDIEIEKDFSEEQIFKLREYADTELVTVASLEEALHSLKTTIKDLISNIPQNTHPQVVNSNTNAALKKSEIVSTPKSVIRRIVPGQKLMPPRSQFQQVTLDQSMRAVELSQQKNLDTLNNQEIPTDNGE